MKELAGCTTIEVENLTRQSLLGRAIEIAGTGSKRSKGLLGRTRLEEGGGMWIVPCESVHTFWMRFPLDLVYIDRKHRVKKVRENVRPWRLSACLVAHSILELPVGTIRRSKTQPGDLLELRPAEDRQAAIDTETTSNADMSARGCIS